MKLTAEIIDHVLEFIRARHFGYTAEATKHQTWLRNKLGNHFSEVLLKHGDPDGNGYLNYQIVMDNWFAEYDKVGKRSTHRCQSCQGSSCNCGRPGPHTCRGCSVCKELSLTSDKYMQIHGFEFKPEKPA